MTPPAPLLPLLKSEDRAAFLGIFEKFAFRQWRRRGARLGQASDALVMGNATLAKCLRAIA
jgi:hypothetical protein